MFKLLSLFLFISALTCTLSGCLYKQPEPDAIPTLDQSRVPRRDEAVDLKDLSTKKTIEL